MFVIWQGVANAKFQDFGLKDLRLWIEGSLVVWWSHVAAGAYWIKAFVQTGTKRVRGARIRSQEQIMVSALTGNVKLGFIVIDNVFNFPT